MSSLNNLDTITHKRLAVYFILIGMFFSIDYFTGISVVYKLWPLLIFNLGVGFIGIFVNRNYRDVLYLWFGEYLILFSFLALYCNFTSWRLLAHIWPLFVMFFGIALITQYFFRSKNRVVLFLGLLLTFLSVFLFLIFSVSSQFWWVIFILIGLSILLSGINK